MNIDDFRNKIGKTMYVFDIKEYEINIQKIKIDNIKIQISAEKTLIDFVNEKGRHHHYKNCMEKEEIPKNIIKHLDNIIL